MPTLYGSRSTIAPCCAATAAVVSMEPSSTTTTSKPGAAARISSTTAPTDASSLYAGTIASRRRSEGSGSVPGAASESATAGDASPSRTSRGVWLIKSALYCRGLGVRICLVYETLYPFFRGGAERWYRNLAERLAAEGYEVTYLTLRRWPETEPPDIPGVRVITVGPGDELYAEGRRRLSVTLRFGGAATAHLLRHGSRLRRRAHGGAPADRARRGRRA